MILGKDRPRLWFAFMAGAAAMGLVWTVPPASLTATGSVDYASEVHAVFAAKCRQGSARETPSRIFTRRESFI